MLNSFLSLFPHWFGISLLSFFPSSPVVDFQCDKAEWVSPPVVEKSRFKGELSVGCVVRGAAGRGVVGLHQDLIDRTVRDAKTVHSGPTADTLDGLPAVKFEVTREDQEDGEKITVRSQDWIATDSQTTLKVRAQSVSVKGTGNFQYIRYVGGDYQVLQDAQDPLLYSIKILSRTEVAQPWFAPKDLFLKEAKKQGMKTFEKRVQILVPELGASL